MLNLGSFALLPQHVVRLILAREELKADEFSKFQASEKSYCTVHLGNSKNIWCIVGCTDVEQEILRLDQPKLVRSAGQLLGVHQLPHDPCQHFNERHPSTGHCPLSYNHECIGLPGWSKFCGASQDVATQSSWVRNFKGNGEHLYITTIYIILVMYFSKKAWHSQKLQTHWHYFQVRRRGARSMSVQSAKGPFGSNTTLSSSTSSANIAQDNLSVDVPSTQSLHSPSRCSSVSRYSNWNGKGLLSLWLNLLGSWEFAVHCTIPCNRRSKHNW